MIDITEDNYKKLFIEKDQTLIYLIPGLIILAFLVKASSLYIAKLIMIKVAAEVKADVEIDMFKSLISLPDF